MVPTLLSSFISASALTLVLGVLYARYRERYLLVWALAWLLWVVRYLYGMVSDELWLAPSAVFLPTLATARAGLILWGAYLLERSSPPMAWRIAIFGDLVWIVVSESLGWRLAPYGIGGVEHYVIFSAALVWSGVLFLRSTVADGPEKVMAGGGLIVLGLLQTTYPVSPQLPEWWPLVGFGTVYATQLLIGFGVVMTYMRRERLEAERLATELSDALTRALSDLLPICAHCKSVRGEDGEWTELEAYVRGTTGTEFSHGICPRCMKEHWPAYAGEVAPGPGDGSTE